MDEKKYITKAEARKKGYVRRNDGIFYRKNVLEKYYENGYLHLPNSPFGDADRKRAGELLARDFYLGHYNKLQSINFTIEIRGTSDSDREESLFHQERYIHAIRCIPQEFWGVIRQVCIDDQELKGDVTAARQSLLSKQSVYHQKMLLCLGLDRLIKFYLQKNKKSS
jgi:hypothetical protein